MKVAERLLVFGQEIEVRPGQTAPILAKKFGCNPRTNERASRQRLPGLKVVAVQPDGYRPLQPPSCEP